MAMSGDLALQRAKAYVKKTLQGMGALQGEKGKDGLDGKSAYEIAKDNGFVGTEGDWLESLKGADGTGADIDADEIKDDIMSDMENNYLSKLGGGRIEAGNYAPLSLENFNGNECVTEFYGEDGFLGALGVDENDAIYTDSDDNSHIIVHTGNVEAYAGKNVDMTEIVFSNTINWSNPDSNLKTFYMVKNGWCLLHVMAHCNKVANDANSVVYDGLPKAPFQVYGKFVGDTLDMQPCNLTITPDGKMLLRGGTEGKDYSFTYTYPVAM